MSLQVLFDNVGLTLLCTIMLLFIALGVYKTVKDWLPW